LSDIDLYGIGKAGGRHRGGRGHDGLTGATVKVRQGSYKGYRGRVIEVKGTFVRVELESQMKVVTGESCNLGKHLSCLHLCIHMVSDVVVCS
jgi:hypothetical protein